MEEKQKRINEILSLSKELKFSENVIKKITNASFTEDRLHGIVHMLRQSLPEDLVVMVADLDYDYHDARNITSYYHSYGIDKDVLYDAVKNKNLKLLLDIDNKIADERELFMRDLLSNQLFVNEKWKNVFNLMKNNDTVYVKHEFNWYTYQSLLVICGGDEKVCCHMPYIPQMGACWSNEVAERMLHGQMFLQFIFKTVVATLKFISERYNADCTIISCDNCFYAPYLYFNINEKGKIANIEEEFESGKSKKIYMDYLKKEYPKAYEWLQNREKGQYFYDDFYTKYIPEK